MSILDAMDEKQINEANEEIDIYEIVKYCRRLIVANLNQYSDTNPRVIPEIVEINSGNDKVFLKHCIAVRDLLGECINILGD